MSNAYDLLNQRFGKLTVIELTKRGNKRAWLCKCDCGGTRIAYATDLVRGKTTSCGCGRKKDLTNQRFGRLVALRPTANNDSNASVIWECLCDCGNSHLASAHNLLMGKIQSCGCLHSDTITALNQARAHDLTQKKFGMLTILEQAPNQGTHRRWKAQCDCGKEIYVTTSALLYSGQQSCGCKTFSKGENTISKLLSDNSIEFKVEYSFDDLIFSDTSKKARYDFYLPTLNVLIEYDGIQHFQVGYGVFDNPEKFAKTQEHDKIKNQYAKDHNITLIRIPYTHLNELCIEDLLPETSGFMVN